MAESIQVKTIRTCDQLEVGRTYICGTKTRAIRIENRSGSRWIAYDEEVDIRGLTCYCVGVKDKEDIIFWEFEISLETNGEKAIILRIEGGFALLVDGIGPFTEV